MRNVRKKLDKKRPLSAYRFTTRRNCFYKRRIAIAPRRCQPLAAQAAHAVVTKRLALTARRNRTRHRSTLRVAPAAGLLPALASLHPTGQSAAATVVVQRLRLLFSSLPTAFLTAFFDSASLNGCHVLHLMFLLIRAQFIIKLSLQLFR